MKAKRRLNPTIRSEQRPKLPSSTSANRTQRYPGVGDRVLAAASGGVTGGARINHFPPSSLKKKAPLAPPLQSDLLIQGVVGCRQVGHKGPLATVAPLGGLAEFTIDDRSV